jgi:N6-L-threonylcarbamoyladenine synthase
MLVLGIETSCDETAAAVVKDGSDVLSSVIASQFQIHEKFGGVVPELASRQHIVAVQAIVEEALKEAHVSMDEVSGIAATRGPGLIGSLLVGFSFGKALAFARKIPFVGVHHIEAHMAAALMGSRQPKFPLVGLVASGGHTDLYRITDERSYRLLAKTMDDAAGEAFDKVGKLLGLEFPGGPALDQTAKGGNPKAIRFPRPARRSNDFSFSGLKTAVAVWVKENGLPTGQKLKDLAASFQEAVVDALMEKLFESADAEQVGAVAVCGGVARNSRLRERLNQEATNRRLELWMAPPELCTDNAAMIASAGHARLARGETDALSMNAIATIPLSI